MRSTGHCYNAATFEEMRMKNAAFFKERTSSPSRYSLRKTPGIARRWKGVPDEAWRKSYFSNIGDQLRIPHFVWNDSCAHSSAACIGGFISFVGFRNVALLLEIHESRN